MTQSYSIWDSFRRNATVDGSGVAFDFGDLLLTHREIVAGGQRLAGQLAGLGVARGDRIAVISDSRLEFFLLLAAAAHSGLILVPINWRLNVEEISRILADCMPKLTFVEPQHRHLAADVAMRGTLLELPESHVGYEDAFAGIAEEAPSLPEVDVATDTPLLVLYTASTDGEPRGATISHGNLIASSIQMNLALKLDTDDCFLGALPFFHMMAITLSLAVNYAGGRTVVRPRFEAQEAARLVAQHGITLLGTFPPMLSSLLDAAEQENGDLSSLKHVMGLDAAPAIERLEASLPAVVFWSIYGQTEAGGNVTYSHWRKRPGAAGRPACLSRVEVVGEDEQLLAPGAVGEIVVRGPGVFQGYWGRDADNAVVGRGGWHHTGDLGRFDEDGYLWYQGRAPHKELIKPGGENVYPGEVEKALRSHPAILHAVVFGIADAQWGEAVIAVCQLRQDVSVPPDAEILRAFVGERLARYKRPKQIIFVDEMPMTPQGLPDRIAVKQAHGVN